MTKKLCAAVSLRINLLLMDLLIHIEMSFGRVYVGIRVDLSFCPCVPNERIAFGRKRRDCGLFCLSLTQNFASQILINHSNIFNKLNYCFGSYES